MNGLHGVRLTVQLPLRNQDFAFASLLLVLEMTFNLVLVTLQVIFANGFIAVLHYSYRSTWRKIAHDNENF